MANQSRLLQAIFSTAQPIDWEIVYQAQLPRVYNFFLYKTGDRQQAQDLTAITFERAWKHRAKYRAHRSSVSTWLFGIARNVLREYLREHSTEQRRSESVLADDLTASEIDIERSVQQELDRERLRRAVLELPEREQDLIAMKYGGELNNREIAEISGLSETNVGSILHRTVKKLREKWDENDG
jgi:RNA polymerase sigma-70 factor, ECF subfamily